MKLPSPSLTDKIVLLVASMGMACAMLAVYTWHMQPMQRMEQHHHELLQQAAATEKISQVRQHLADASTVVHAVLSAQDETQIFLAQEQLAQLSQALEVHLRDLYPLLPAQDLVLDSMHMQARHMFAAGQQVIAARLRWPNDRTRQVLTHNFTPALKKLHADADALKTDTNEVFAEASHNLATLMQASTRQIHWASYLSVLLISVCAAGIVWHYVSRPISRMTRSMQHMRQQPIADPERHDEIDSMAQTLQSFGTALQETAPLEHGLRQQQKNNVLIEQLQQLTRAFPGVIFQMSLTPGQPLKLHFASPQWTQLMGLPPEADTRIEAASQMIRHHDPEVTHMAEQHYLESAATLKPVNFELEMHMCDGVTRWIKTRATPHLHADGSTTFYGVWLDVSKEVLQARALEKAKRQAEQSAAAKTALQASISHEIRTPLNAILGLTQLLLKADLPAAQREQLHNILRASQHLRGIINAVLDFSKMDAGQIKLESMDFSLENVVLDVISMCQEEASRKGLVLHHTMACEVPNNLRGDPHRIAQILLNYVNNAIKFTASGDIHITLRLAANSTLHRIVLHGSVKDTGPGIPADRIPLLFQAFQQADNSITRRFGGTGLGLTISRALAQLMGVQPACRAPWAKAAAFGLPQY